MDSDGEQIETIFYESVLVMIVTKHGTDESNTTGDVILADQLISLRTFPLGSESSAHILHRGLRDLERRSPLIHEIEKTISEKYRKRGWYIELLPAEGAVVEPGPVCYTGKFNPHGFRSLVITDRGIGLIAKTESFGLGTRMQAVTGAAFGVTTPSIYFGEVGTILRPTMSRLRCGFEIKSEDVNLKLQELATKIVSNTFDFRQHLLTFDYLDRDSGPCV